MLSNKHITVFEGKEVMTVKAALMDRLDFLKSNPKHTRGIRLQIDTIGNMLNIINKGRRGEL